jgi:pyruvate formate lyase activating enzyme
MTVAQVINEVVEDTVFFDESRGGVTFSGGEPFMQAAFLDAMLDACRERGIHTTVDTCGVTGRETLLRLSSKVDLFLCDLKMMDSAKHKMYTGMENEGILENLCALAKQHKGVIVRVPIIPGINDGDDNIEQTRGFLSSAGLSRVDLLPYHEIGTDKYRRLAREYRLEGLKSPTAERIDSIREQFERDGFRVRIGG